MGHLITAPEKVVAKIEQMETAALSPDPTLSPGAPSPWLRHVHPTPASSIPMISDCITTTLMQEALRCTPSHKAAGADGVPGPILKHLPPVSHEALHLLFQSMVITGITPPSWLKSHTILYYKKRGPHTAGKLPTDHTSQCSTQALYHMYRNLSYRLHKGSQDSQPGTRGFLGRPLLFERDYPP